MVLFLFVYFFIFCKWTLKNYLKKLKTEIDPVFCLLSNFPQKFNIQWKTEETPQILMLGKREIIKNCSISQVNFQNNCYTDNQNYILVTVYSSIALLQ